MYIVYMYKYIITIIIIIIVTAGMITTRDRAERFRQDVYDYRCVFDATIRPLLLIYYYDPHLTAHIYDTRRRDV
jgi:hypothetical protein